MCGNKKGERDGWRGGVKEMALEGRKEREDFRLKDFNLGNALIWCSSTLPFIWPWSVLTPPFWGLVSRPLLHRRPLATEISWLTDRSLEPHDIIDYVAEKDPLQNGSHLMCLGLQLIWTRTSGECFGLFGCLSSGSRPSNWGWLCFQFWIFRGAVAAQKKGVSKGAGSASRAIKSRLLNN